MSQPASRRTRPLGCGIFLSHSSRDNPIVANIATRLTEWGFQSLFLDFDPELGIPAGRDWEQEIYRQIRLSGAVVIISSRSSAGSKWCFAELALARALGKEVFPIRVDDAPAEPQLTDRQFVDLRDGNVAFERLRRGLHEAGLDPEDDFQWDHSRDPYPGLNAFSGEDAGVYFGREDLIRDTLDQLNQMIQNGDPRLALVIGGSGSGKSSLVRAGIIPRLKKPGRKFCVLPAIRPQYRPIEALALALAEVPPHPDWKALRTRFLSDEPDNAAALVDACIDLRLAAGSREAAILIVVDQFEEALVSSSAAELIAFHRLLRGAIEAEGSPVFAMATLRSDFLGRFQNHPIWSGTKHSLVNVVPVSVQRIPEIIEGPAARVGIDLEPGLVQSMVQDVATDDALPLLAFSLRELYLRSKALGRMTLEIYSKELNGIQGAVGRVVERLKREAKLDDALMEQVRRAFLNLVQVSEDGRFVRKSAPMDDMPAAALPFLEKCIQSRLMTVSDVDGRRVVEVTHESLFRVWSDLSTWLDERRAFLLWLRRARIGAEEWRASGQPVSMLMPAGRLPEARRWLAERPDDLIGIERDYIDASIQEDERANEAELKRRQRETETQLIAESRNIAAQAEQLLVSDRGQALALALRSWRTAKTDQARRAIADAFPQLLVTLKGHTLAITAASFSPDSRSLVTASADGTARVWDAANGWKRTVLEGHIGGVYHAAFSSNGDRIVTSSGDATARVWDAAEGQQLAILKGHTGAVRHAGFSPDGQWIVTVSDDVRVCVWNSVTGVRAVTSNEDSELTLHAMFSPDGGRILSCGDSGARVFSAATGQHISRCEVYDGAVMHTAFSPDGRLIVTANPDRTGQVWDASTGQPLVTLRGHAKNILRTAFSPDGQRIVTASDDRTARLWNAVTGDVLAILEGHTDSVLNVVFSKDGQWIATASRDRTARIWDAATGNLLATMRGHGAPVLSAEFAKDGRIVTAAEEAVAHVWNPAAGEMLLVLKHEGYVTRAAFSPDGERIVTASADQTARVWNATTGTLLLTLTEHTEWVDDAAFSSDGTRILTSGRDETACVWNASTGQMLAKLEGNEASFSRDGQRVLTCNRTGTVRVFNLATGTAVQFETGGEDLLDNAVFSLDENLIVTTSKRTARVWNAENGQLLATLEGHQSRVICAAFSSNGLHAVTRSYFGTTQVWDMTTGQLIATMEDARDFFASDGNSIGLGGELANLVGQIRDVHDASFSSDGKKVFTGDDGFAEVRDASTGNVIAFLEGHAGRLSSAAFSPDGQRIVTAGEDHTARVYRLLTLSDIAQLLAR